MRSLEATQTPWTGAPSARLPNAREELARRCGAAASELLPARVEILLDPAFTEGEVTAFVESVAAQLARETAVWRTRLDELVTQGLISEHKLRTTCKQLQAAQTWYVYSTHAGGLTAGAPLEAAGDPETESSGVVPCSAATHHGVAWWPTSEGRGVGLVTSRRVDGHWNWDEDIGHEAAHASFGPVPLYSQTLEAEGFRTKLADAYAEADGKLTEVLIARVTYLISEVMVAFVRGEQRTTGSGLPGLHSFEDLRAFCTLAHRLMPGAGFDTALKAAEQEGMPLAVWSGPTIRMLGAAALNAAPIAIPLINEVHPPEPAQFAQVAAA